jgi:GH15 family glucan-1,4-alpha-glucosidase
VTLVLSTNALLDIADGRDRASGTTSLAEGDQVAFAVEYGSSWQPPPPVVGADEIRHMIDDTSRAWRSWGITHQRYEGPFAADVHLAGRVLRGLTFVPTGAIVAAPTTSLPETIGGTRNWDYRYCWVRDASLTLDALWVAACPDEEQHFFRFLTTAASSVHHRDQVQVMFGIGGDRDLTERELSWLEGWRGSRPVRVGNGAWDQRQNDVYGELLAAAHRLRDLVDLEDDNQRLLFTTLADLAAKVWTEPDCGIWEMRDEPRHHLHSKLMCWVALDRAIDMAHQLRAEERLVVWRSARDAIREAILRNAWNEDIGAFTQSFGSSAIDASALAIPIVGFLPPSDPRVLATVEAIETRLMDASGLVTRYRTPDGLEGEEGAFLLCTFWLSHAHALTGNVPRARELFTQAVAFANDVGLFSEEIEPGTGASLGNFPQAFSHIGLINAPWAIKEAERAH